MIDVLVFSLILVGLSGTTILIGYKYRVFNYLQANGRFGINKWAECRLCISFWIGLFYSLVYIIFGGDWIMIIAPFVSAPFTRAIIK